jgi:hypothetical protein
VFSFLRRRPPRFEQERPRDPHWEKVDESWFAGFYWASQSETLHGPLAEFYPDGQLFRLSWYTQGRPSGSHSRLVLKWAVPEAEVFSLGCSCSFSYGWEEVWWTMDSELETLCEPAFWNDWVAKWIGQICAGQKVNRVQTISSSTPE